MTPIQTACGREEIRSTLFSFCFRWSSRKHQLTIKGGLDCLLGIVSPLLNSGPLPRERGIWGHLLRHGFRIQYTKQNNTLPDIEFGMSRKYDHRQNFSLSKFEWAEWKRCNLPVFPIEANQSGFSLTVRNRCVSKEEGKTRSANSTIFLSSAAQRWIYIYQ